MLINIEDSICLTTYKLANSQIVHMLFTNSFKIKINRNNVFIHVQHVKEVGFSRFTDMLQLNFEI